MGSGVGVHPGSGQWGESTPRQWAVGWEYTQAVGSGVGVHPGSGQWAVGWKYTQAVGSGVRVHPVLYSTPVCTVKTMFTIINDFTFSFLSYPSSNPPYFLVARLLSPSYCKHETV